MSNAALSKDWFIKHFIPKLKHYYLKNNVACKALLFLENILQIFADINLKIKVFLHPYLKRIFCKHT